MTPSHSYHTNGNGNGRGMSPADQRPPASAKPAAETDRLPPHNREAERGILSCILGHEQAFDEVASAIGPEAFYVFGHQLIFRAMGDVRARGRPIDYITLKEWLDGAKQLADAGGLDYLVDLWDARPGGVGKAKFYTAIVREKAIARELIGACNQLAALAYEPGATADEMVEEAERRMFALGGLNSTDEVVGQDAAVRLYLEDLDRLKNRGDTIMAADPVMSTWPDLDRITLGMHPEELILVASRPGVGKSVFAVNLAVRVAGRGECVLFCALEQSAREQVFRQVANHSRIGGWQLRSGMLDKEQRMRVVDAAAALSPLPIFYDDRPQQSLMRIAGNARRLKSKGKLRLLIVDYLQLIDGAAGGRRGEGRHEEVGRISRYLKLLARELKIPVLACAQLNRGSEDRRGQKPRLSDLRESGSLEADADTVLLLHKSEPDDADRGGDVLEVHVGKNRNGPQGEINLFHLKANFALENYASDNTRGGIPE